MTLEKLQIKELSPSGELLGVLTCHAGQITVFRALNNSDLGKYLRAFAGVSGKERLSISIDDSPFAPNQHHLIGFGEHFARGGEEGSTAQFLLGAGVPEQSLGATLASIGLDARAEIPCSELTPDEERRLRITAATFDPGKALIIHDPFDSMSSTWRERFADVLTQFAKNRNGLVVIPLLSFRPEAWIDNERVARLQVGQNVQKTIGFASTPSQVHSVIQRVREEANAEALKGQAPQDSLDLHSSDSSVPTDAAAPEYTPTQERSPQRLLPRNMERWVPIALGAFVLFGVIGGLYGSSLFESPLPSQSDSSRVGPELAALNNPSEESSDQDSTTLQIERTETLSPSADKIISPEIAPGTGPVGDAPITAPTILPTIGLVRLLDLYPQPIRSSILESFEGQSVAPAGSAPASPRLSRDESRRTSSPQRSAKTSDLLSVLETTSSDKVDESASRQPPQRVSEGDLQGMAPEERREVIRQRFLEAIQRASESQR
jgi:ABC-type transport system involved in cytochrome c biogenesis ATPase subunit